MLLSIALFTGIFCAGCGARSDEILLESQEDASDTVEETEQEEREMTDEIPSVTPEPQEIFVDVCGAVNQPGVYEMDPDSRVFQAIEAAGGMTEEASGISVNQAQPLSDGQQVYVPTVQEAEEGSFVPAVPETTYTLSYTTLFRSIGRASCRERVYFLDRTVPSFAYSRT